MLQVPYCHITFTLPHCLNGLARRNPWEVYNLMFRSAWQTVRRLCKKLKNVGGLPGMSAVLHTWGSDLKYHVHLHCLVTFGGYNEQDGQWHWPKRKRKIAPYRKLSGKYRAIFLKRLKKLMESGQVDYHQSYEELESSLPKKRWVVNHQWPTAETKVIEEYLGRYICRIGISNKRLSYDKNGENVCIEYNNYREQKAGEPAPKAYRHMPPLVAMHQILQHQLPRYFPRSRHSSPAEALAKEGWAACGSNLRTPERPFDLHSEVGRGNSADNHPDPTRLIERRALPLRSMLGYRFSGGTPGARSSLYPV